MTRLPFPHPFQPALFDSPLWRRCVAFVAAGADEPGFLECLAVIGLAFSLIIPGVIWGGW